ncbi:hypothetical protein I8751_13365 [Nostocaceae cyanobacterium CENA357]|uniref:Uncharacterized protein n=1 Tax=Atlanticothrix silvestris CENA357 TaxID=1725252 RepID=A0A8J7HJ61_9CYAN|nr:hypothetical protein [Atlanticothrix silvestris]MBH8553345.1 hypothetical protein [Atlanticothrix silvestris CENA357]
MFHAINSRDIPSLRVAITLQENQYNQPPQLASPDHNIKSVTSIFLTFLFIGFILGWLLQHNRYKKRQAIYIFRKAKTLDTIQKLTPQTQSQIEILERIWNKP